MFFVKFAVNKMLQWNKIIYTQAYTRITITVIIKKNK